MSSPLIRPIGQPTRIEPTSPIVPSRIIVRATAEFLITGLAEGIANYGSLRRAVIMAAITVANGEHITRSALRTWRYTGSAQIPPESERRPVSILSLSQSLAKPFETTRSHVNALVRYGLCVKVSGGVIVPDEVLASAKVSASEIVKWDAFLQMIAQLKALQFDFDAVRGDRTHADSTGVHEGGAGPPNLAPPQSLVSRVAAEFFLNTLVGASAIFDDDWAAGLIFTAFMNFNSENWSTSLDEAWRYSRADTPPPDELRRPATIAEVAARLGLGKELVRRQVHELIEAGRLERVNGGYLTSMAHMQSPQTRASGAAVVKAFYRMVYDLTALGYNI